MTKADSTLVENRERIEVMEEHLKNVRQEVGHTNALIAAKKKEMATEEHLCALAARESGRCVLATPSLHDEQRLLGDINILAGTAMSARDDEDNLERSPCRNNTRKSFLLSEKLLSVVRQCHPKYLQLSLSHVLHAHHALCSWVMIHAQGLLLDTHNDAILRVSGKRPTSQAYNCWKNSFQDCSIR